MKRTIIQLTLILTATLLTISCSENTKTNKNQTLSKADNQAQNSSSTQSSNQIQRPSHPLQLPDNLQQQTIERKVQPLPRHNNISYTTPTFDTTNYNERKEYLITPTEKQLVKHTGVALFIGEGSVKKPTTISITPLTEKEIVNVPTNLVNLTKYHNGYRFLPDGQTFEQEIAVAMKYDTTNIPFGYGAADIFTYYYDTKSSQWEQIPRDSVDEINHIIYSRTTHFTDYINGVLKVPETSDAMAYTPTSIKDLKAAEPLNGITLMSPPQANNKGTANLSYPITVPAGRRGMQPDLNITYNSSGGNGILGLGWDLNISSISVETRWGVPYFDQNKESETYLLDGETLVTSYFDTLDEGELKFRLHKPTYRNEWEDRDTSGYKQFYPRVEGAFKKIIRHGKMPMNYWWEVVDKSGTRYFYGMRKINDSTMFFDSQSTLADYNWNVVKWCLTEVRDVYGNNITYKYYTYLNDASSQQDFGKQIYVSDINYTGYKNTVGKYNIKFVIDTTGKLNHDVTTSGRYGFKEINKCLLNKISVLYDNSHIKTYYFGYKEGAFNKTLLCNFYETDTVIRLIDLMGLYDRCPDQENPDLPHPLITHKFEYDSLGSNLYTEEQILNTGETEIGWNVFSGNVASKLSNMGGSESISTDKGGGINFGIGSDPTTKWLTVGGSHSYQLGKDRGVVTMMDINGDGYPDKVYRDGDEIRFILQRPNNDGDLISAGFADGNTRINGSITNFSYTESTTRPWGVNASVLPGSDGDVLSSVSGGVGWGSTKSSTSTYFSDVNGDGLVDIIVNGNIFINRLNEPGINMFINETTKDTIFSGGSCGGYVLNDVPVDPAIYGDRVDTVGHWNCFINQKGEQECHWITEIVNYKAPEIYYPNIQAVRVWVAPYNGKIKIESQARIPDDVVNLMKITQIGDGLKLSIQKSGQPTLLSELKLDTITYSGTMNYSNLNVKRGDKIFFRMESLEKRTYDKVIWDPKITYTSYKNKSGVDILTGLDRIDGNKDSIFRFKASEDFALSSQGGLVQTYVGGRLLIKPKIEVEGPLTEPLNYKVYKNDTIVLNRVIPKNTIVNINNIINNDTIISISKNDKLRAELTCFGRVKWPLVHAGVEMSIIESDNDTIQDIIDTISVPGDTIYTLTYNPEISRNIYQYSKIPSLLWQSNYTGTISIKPVIYPTTITSNYKLRMTIKDENGLVDTFTFSTPTPINTSKYVNVISGKKYYIDYYAESTLGEIIDSISTSIQYGSTTVKNASGFYTNYKEEDYSIFGALYRGWGQFGYKPQDTTINYIDTTLLVLNIMNTTSVIDTSTVFTITSDDPESPVTNGYNPLAGNFFAANPDYEHNYWIPYGNINYFCKDTMANIFKYDDVDIDTTILEADNPIPSTTTNPKPTVANKESYSEPSRNYNVNARLDLSLIDLSIGGTVNKGKQRVTSDLMDVNGDGFPDIVSGSVVLCSKPRGGLSGKIFNHITGNNVEADVMDYEATGASAGGQKMNVGKEMRNGPVNSKISMGGAAGGSTSESTGGSTWIDINGDGLPDKVKFNDPNSTVYLNYGYGFSRSEAWNSSGIKKSHSNSLSLSDNWDLFSGINTSRGGKQFNLVDGSISGGLGITGGENITERSFLDVNGDGLIDIVYLDGDTVRANINTGTGFSNPIPLIGDGSIDYSLTLGASINGGISLGVPIWIFKIVGCVSGYKGWNIAYSKSKWIDMNNDGYPDYVTEGDGNEVKVRYSLIGKANLLKKVITPTRTNIDIDYQLSASSVNSPQRHWQMISTKISNHDTYDPAQHDTIYTTYKYKNRYYDRYEREDYGYDSVLTYSYLNSNTVPYRTNIDVYYNDNYMFKGIKNRTITADSQGRKIQDNIYDYRAKDRITGDAVNESLAFCSSDAYPAINEEIVKYYLLTGDTSAQITTKKAYNHGPYGNVKRYADYGDITTTNDDVYSEINYYEDTSKYIVGVPYDFNVISDTINYPSLRHKQANINSFGDMDQLNINISNNTYMTYDYWYDQYGNIIKRISPADAAGHRMTTKYTYDNTLYCLPILVQDSNLGYQSSATYNYKWAAPVETIDIAGNPQRYTYDSRGRIATVQGPKEIASGYPYTIKYEYSDLVMRTVSGNIYLLRKPWARTLHYDPSDTSNKIKTVTFIDGLGRIIQTKKDIDSYGTELMMVSGREKYDKLGRTTTTYQPITETLVNSTTLYLQDTIFNKNISGITPTRIAYDILDRVDTTIYPDLTKTTTIYNFGQDASTIKRFKTIVKDQSLNQTTIYTDPRQLKTQITSALGSITKFSYDRLGQLVTSTDPENQSTTNVYDMAGRRTSRTHPSSGLTQWKYDKIGHMIEQTMSSGEVITYDYSYNQLKYIKYTNRPWNNVWYEYGAANTQNQTGRLIRQQDVTGVQDFVYDSMGNIKQNRHTYVVPNSSNAFTFITRWNYDSWNRVSNITYPDGDIVTYAYNKGGLLKSIKGNKYGVQTNYIRNINYDTYEQRAEEYFGNGTKTVYFYESLMRRLDKLITIDSIGLYLQYNKYTYYPEGNIKQIQNTGIDPYTHNYDYDHDYQLVHAAGSGTWSGTPISYDMVLNYSSSGKIERKEVRNSKRLDNNGTTQINYRNNYHYTDPSNPYGVRLIHDDILNKDYDIKWDIKGNMISHENSKWGIRQLCWTEDNRLENEKDGKMGAYYNYNASGERNLKVCGHNIDVTQNGTTVNIPALDQQTLYASSLVTVNDQGYTKHYFEEGKRICSKIGNGRLTNVTAPVTPINGEYSKLLSELKDNVIGSFSICIGAKPYLQTQDLYSHIILPNINQTSSTEPGFYYHSDHLGSSSYITGDNGQKTQTLAYMPSGEDWVDLKHNSPSYTTPYKFTGKEKDEETSYNYYGARYYTDNLSIFLSTDPMSDKYPNLTSYNYCANNPVMLIDPNGMNIDDYFTNSGKYLGSDGAKTDNVRIIDEGRWNDIKTTNNDGSETVNHYVGYANSSAFSESAENMSDNDKLNVFQHYNPTDLSVEKYNNPGENYMAFYASGDKISERKGTLKKAMIVNLQINNTSDNANNIINSFGHEDDHYSLFKEIGIEKYSAMPRHLIEQRAIKHQMNLPSWKNTTPQFKEGMQWYGYRNGMFPCDF